jgi:hypothetical protein
MAAVFEVSNTLGAGFLVGVSYKGYPIEEYFADILVNGVLVMEPKWVLPSRSTSRTPKSKGSESSRDFMPQTGLGTLPVEVDLVAEMHSGQCSRSINLENASNLRKSG